MGIFRKTSLERLRSPEQLDEPLRVIGRKESVALYGLGVLAVLGLLWGFFGSMPDRGQGEGKGGGEESHCGGEDGRISR